MCTQFKVSCSALISVKVVQPRILFALFPCKQFLHVFLLYRDGLVYLLPLRMSLFYFLYFRWFFPPPSPWVSPGTSLLLFSSVSHFSLDSDIHAFSHLPPAIWCLHPNRPILMLLLLSKPSYALMHIWMINAIQEF